MIWHHDWIADYKLRLRPLSEKKKNKTNKQIHVNNIMKNNLAVVIHENVQDITL